MVGHAMTRHGALPGLPALESAFVDADDHAREAQARTYAASPLGQFVGARGYVIDGPGRQVSGKKTLRRESGFQGREDLLDP